MAITDTTATRTNESPPVPDCPLWCLEPAGHHDPTAPPGNLVRLHTAYRETVPTSAGGVEVEVYQWENYSPGEGLSRSPVMLFMDGTKGTRGLEGLVLADVIKLNAALREVESVFSRIARETAQTAQEMVG